MTAAYPTFGGLLIAVTLVDAFWTTLGLGGGGPLTQRLATGVWRTALAIHRLTGRRAHRLLHISAVIILLLVIASWVALLWLGWLLIFAADPTGVVHATTGVQANLPQRIYFTGFTLFTLGVGDYVPQGEPWRFLTAVAALNGLFVITLSITYLIPVLSAAVEKRRLAAMIAALGRTPAEILATGWDGQTFVSLEQPLTSAARDIELHAQRHLAYPVLHHFHSPVRHTALSLRIAALDDALTVMSGAAAQETRMSTAVTRSVRSAISDLMEHVQTSSSAPRGGRMGAPELSADALPPDCPRSSEGEWRNCKAEAAERRTIAHAFIVQGGWTWKDISTR